MAYTSNYSGSDTEVQPCSKNCVKTYEKLQKQFDEQRQTLSKANLEVLAYQLGLESVESQLVLDETLREKDDLKAKLEQFKTSSKNLNKLLNSQLSAKDKLVLDMRSITENDSRLDNSVYRPTANKTSASVSQVEASTSQTSKTSVEMPRFESVRPSGVIIKENESVKPKQAEKPRITTQNLKVDRRRLQGDDYISTLGEALAL
ncbi:hypothetical protein Tco_1468410 [Tanacetum coccineum]